MNVTVLGAGAWGTALALQLTQNGHSITLWGHNSYHLSDLQRDLINQRYLPGFPLPPSWTFNPNLASSIQGADAVIVAVPSKAFRTLSQTLRDHSKLLVSVTKGIEADTGLTMTGILRELAPKAQIAALSGPSLAAEVARGIPTAIVAASAEISTAKAVQHLFHNRSLRVYTSQDSLGVELGGALKNVVAIAAGVCDGLGFGDNSKAALITRGIVEMRRLGVASGAQPETFAGLSGLGDLTVTCFSRLSRNRAFGERLGRGESMDSIQKSTVSVSEGVPTARSAQQLARKNNIETPIIDEVFSLLYEGKDPGRAVRDLMARDSKQE